MPKSREDKLGHMAPWVFCDMNYAEDPHDCSSTSRYAFMLAGGLISWKSKKQTSVALSMTEAEYYALGIMCQEAIWLKQLCQELQMTSMSLLTCTQTIQDLWLYLITPSSTTSPNI